MRRVLLLEHVSLDGFVGGPNGEMDWVRFQDEALWDEVSAFTARSDTAIYGRVTFQMMESYWPTVAEKPGASRHDIEHSRWANAVTKLVFSRTLDHSDWENTRFVKSDVAGVIGEMKSQPGKDLLMLGSPSLARDFLAQDLIDELWLSVNPLILGAGIPLFDGRAARTGLELVKSRQFSNGVVGLHYAKIE
jgi:dihydrofolate reductase